MAELEDDMAAIREQALRVGMPATAADLRGRGDRRRRRAAVTGAGLGVVLLAGGIFAATRPAQGQQGPVQVATAPSSAAATSEPPMTGPTFLNAALNGERLIRIVVEDGSKTALMLGADDDDKVYAKNDAGATDRSTWLLVKQGKKYQIMLGSLHGTSKVCMTSVHDAAPGSVRDRVCDASNPNQLFTIEKTDLGLAFFQGKHYVQVIDGPRTLVPDLPEALTTTYSFQDRGVPGPELRN